MKKSRGHGCKNRFGSEREGFGEVIVGLTKRDGNRVELGKRRIIDLTRKVLHLCLEFRKLSGVT